MRHTPPSISMCMPFLNWFVLIVSATADNLVESSQLLRKGRQHFRLGVRDDDQVLDPDPAQAGQVDARLDGDDVAGLEDAPRLLGEARILVDDQADAVSEAVSERLAEPGRGDPVPRSGVDS